MKNIFTLLVFISFSMNAQENAAPSIHLNLSFPSQDAILKMQKIKIVQSANASYFEVNLFNGGYAGFQQTPDVSYGVPNISIFSIWDPNTSGGIFSNINYTDPLTVSSRFGGEGNGWKTINPYNWQTNIWYNVVQRSWVSNNKLNVATFINNLTTNKWFHMATISKPFIGTYLNGNNDSFLENWDGTNSQWNGSFIRKAYFKEAYNLNLYSNWEKSSSVYFSANNSTADINRNGIYHNSFNAFIDNTESAYCMQHGGNTVPSTAFNGGRTLNLASLPNQSLNPILTLPSLNSVVVNFANQVLSANWSLDDTKSPQFSTKFELYNEMGNRIMQLQDTIPQKRNFTNTITLANGTYQLKTTITDIFNQNSLPYFISFKILNGVISENGNNIGINISNPQRNLHIKDVLRLEPRSSSPNNPSEGDIYYDSILKKLRVFDGLTWQNCW